MGETTITPFQGTPSTSLPLMVRKRQPAETNDPEITARLTEWFGRARVFIGGYTTADDAHLPDPDTSLSKAQLLSLVIGFTGCDTRQDRDQRTYTLIYTDPDQGKRNFQTICVPYYAPSSPLLFERDGHACRIVWKPTGEVLTRPRLHAGIFGASNHYYSRVGPDLAELPTAAIVSPYSTCAGGCLGCNRNEVGSFTPPPRDYIAQHVAALAADYDQRGWDRAALISVNITTGCQPDEDRELSMMLKLIAEYRRQGFSNAGFFPFTYAIDTPGAMDQLREAGCLGFIGTVECFNDAERLRQWGRAKGAISFEQHLAKYRRAREAGFEIVETDYVLGEVPPPRRLPPPAHRRPHWKPRPPHPPSSHHRHLRRHRTHHQENPGSHPARPPRRRSKPPPNPSNGQNGMMRT